MRYAGSEDRGPSGLSTWRPISGPTASSARWMRRAWRAAGGTASGGAAWSAEEPRQRVKRISQWEAEAGTHRRERGRTNISLLQRQPGAALASADLTVTLLFAVGDANPACCNYGNHGDVDEA